MALPASDTPVWQIPLLDQATSDRISQQLSQMGWGGMVSQLTDILPATAADQKRFYVNWTGACCALDLVTGKMLWRTSPFFDYTNVQQMVMQGQMGGMGGGAIEAVGDRLLVIKGAQPNPRMQQINLTRLSCLACDTGKTIWTSERQGAGSLAEWDFVGKPLVIGDVVYLCAFNQQAPAMHLMCIGLDKGDLRWQLELGNAVGGQDFRGMAQHPVPTLLEHDGKVLVLTNNGALLAVDVSSHQIEWAFAYGARVNAGQQQFFNGEMAGMAPSPLGAMLLSGSTLYFKETGGEELYAMDLSGPALKWKRPIDASVGLAAGDDQNLFLAGSEVDCINIDSRMMLWSNRLSSESGDIVPLSAANRLYLFDDRGVRELRTDTGEIGAAFRGYDRESAGGSLSRTADRLITISTRAITAYPLNRNGPP